VRTVVTLERDGTDQTGPILDVYDNNNNNNNDDDDDDICKLLPNTLTYKLHTKEQQTARRFPKTEAERCQRNK